MAPLWSDARSQDGAVRNSLRQAGDEKTEAFVPGAEVELGAERLGNDIEQLLAEPLERKINKILNSRDSIVKTKKIPTDFHFLQLKSQ